MKIYRYPFKLRLAKENIFGVEQQIMQNENDEEKKSQTKIDNISKK